MRRLSVAALAFAAVVVVLEVPASAATTTFTNVVHNVTFSVSFPDDICGPRANVVTITRRVELQHLTARDDGTFNFHYTADVTYFSDFVDPAIPDVSGQLTEVENVVLSPGEPFIHTVTFHDFLGGDVKIFYRLQLAVVDGTPIVDREVLKVTGCP